MSGRQESMLQFKICLVGSFAVGKTSTVARFTRGIFSNRYMATLGVKIDRKTLQVNGLDVRMILWDMAGEDEFAKVNATYLRGAGGYVLAVDGTRRITLDQALMLERRVRMEAGPVPFVVMVNKADLSEHWEVTEADLRRLAAQGWQVVRTSARTGEGVEEMFQMLAGMILERRAAGGGAVKTA